jgi:hypothetical protein
MMDRCVGVCVQRWAGVGGCGRVWVAGLVSMLCWSNR